MDIWRSEVGLTRNWRLHVDAERGACDAEFEVAESGDAFFELDYVIAEVVDVRTIRFPMCVAADSVVVPVKVDNWRLERSAIVTQHVPLSVVAHKRRQQFLVEDKSVARCVDTHGDVVEFAEEFLVNSGKMRDERERPRLPYGSVWINW